MNELTREVTIPADWKPPFLLRFYCADDYFADAEKHKPGQLGTESFFEHRVKQALVEVAAEIESCPQPAQRVDTAPS